MSVTERADALVPLPRLLDRAVAAFASRIAIEYRDREIRYDELGRLVDCFAARLLSAGIQPGDTIALYLPNTPFHPVAFFGALKAGARVVHLSPLDAARELAHKLTDSGARLLVTVNFEPMEHAAVKLADLGLLDHIIVGDDQEWDSAARPADSCAASASRVTPMTRWLSEGAAAMPEHWPAIRIEDVALLQYTGGTTGTPKGAMLTHANLSSAVSSFGSWLSAQGESGPQRVIGVLPLFHIFALTSVLNMPLSRGDTILLRSRFDVAQILRDIEERKATFLAAVPTMFIALSADPSIERRDLSSLRRCFSGGAPLPIEVARRFERMTGHRIHIGWGMTETCGCGTLTLPDIEPSSVGLPLPNVVIEVVALDDPARRLGPRELGELRVKGPGISQGYWNCPDETARAFVDGFLLTGDVGYIDERGSVYLVDRKKDLIISGGFNVYPAVIEAAIYEHPDVEEVLVIGVPDEYRGESAKAFIKLRKGAAQFNLDQLRAFLADKVGRHELPAALEFRDALPRTAVGKLSRKELAEEAQRAAGTASGRAAGIAPEPSR